MGEAVAAHRGLLHQAGADGWVQRLEDGIRRLACGFHQQVEVEVLALSLFPGTYFVSVWVKKQGGRYDDAVHEALEFDVEEASLTPYPTYFARYSHNSQVYAPSRWRFIN